MKKTVYICLTESRSEIVKVTDNIREILEYIKNEYIVPYQHANGYDPLYECGLSWDQYYKSDHLEQVKDFLYEIWQLKIVERSYQETTTKITVRRPGANKFYLRSFVRPEDWTKLIDILTKIRNGTVKQEVSVLVLYGDGANGKSTLMRVMEQISPTSVRVPATFMNFIDDGFPRGTSEYLTGGRLILIGEDRPEEHLDTFHNKINDMDGNVGTVRVGYTGREMKFDIGVAVAALNSDYKIKCDKKRRRMPMYLNLPYHFKYNPSVSDDLIVDRCVEEFLELIKIEGK